MNAPHLITVLICFASATALCAQEDVADIKSEKLMVGKDERQSYFLVHPTTKEKPKKGFSLLVVLPGGDGGEAFHPFVKRIRKHSVPKDFFVAQPVSYKWTTDQKVVWPTEGLKVEKQEFSTEQFVNNVIKSIQDKQDVNPEKIYCMGWSSSGPAVYSLALMKNTIVKGSYVVMSVYKPKQLPPLENAKGRSIYIEHSPQDKTCPFWMAIKGHADLKQNNARIILAEYDGGHGWRGDIYGRVSKALRWLDSTHPVFAKGKNLVLNPNLTDGDKEPKHWKKGNKIPGVEYIWVQKAKMKETSFLQIKKTEKRFFPIASWRQQIEYDGKSEAILVSSQVKADEVTKAILDVIFLDKNNRVISHKWAAYIGRKNSSEPAVTHDWKRYSGTVDVPSNTAKIAISLQCYGPGTVSFSKVTAQFSD